MNTKIKSLFLVILTFLILSISVTIASASFYQLVRCIVTNACSTPPTDKYLDRTNWICYYNPVGVCDNAGGCWYGNSAACSSGDRAFPGEIGGTQLRSGYCSASGCGYGGFYKFCCNGATVQSAWPNVNNADGTKSAACWGGGLPREPGDGSGYVQWSAAACAPPPPPPPTCNSFSFFGGSMNGFIQGSDVTVNPGGSFTMTCNYGSARPPCIDPAPVTGMSCSYTGFAGDNAAMFSCTAPSTLGTYPIHCITGARNSCCGGNNDYIGTLIVSPPPPTTIDILSRIWLDNDEDGVRYDGNGDGWYQVGDEMYIESTTSPALCNGIPLSSNPSVDGARSGGGGAFTSPLTNCNPDPYTASMSLAPGTWLINVAGLPADYSVVSVWKPDTSDPTYTVNSDKSLTVTGTAGAQINPYFGINRCTASGMAFSLSPTSVYPSGSTTPSVSGILKACSGRTLYIKKDSCTGTQFSTCVLNSAGACTSALNAFTAPSPTGDYWYYGCIDANKDGDTADSGEAGDWDILTVKDLTVSFSCSGSDKKADLSWVAAPGSPTYYQWYKLF